LAVTDLDEMWVMKKYALYAVFTEIFEAIYHERLKEDFDLLYWAKITHGHIAMSFRDLDEALRVFRRVKGICEDN
jgi:hypothetical protein